VNIQGVEHLVTLLQPPKEKSLLFKKYGILLEHTHAFQGENKYEFRELPQKKCFKGQAILYDPLKNAKKPSYPSWGTRQLIQLLVVGGMPTMPMLLQQ
jgi:hypothetical protein